MYATRTTHPRCTGPRHNATVSEAMHPTARPVKVVTYCHHHRRRHCRHRRRRHHRRRHHHRRRRRHIHCPDINILVDLA